MTKCEIVSGPAVLSDMHVLGSGPFPAARLEVPSFLEEFFIIKAAGIEGGRRVMAEHPIFCDQRCNGRLRMAHEKRIMSDAKTDHHVKVRFLPI
jgi:hypothetical protein